MEQSKTITAYHGTDEKYLRDIMNNGFIVKHNPKHWLGNGIYFFLDYDIAKWWSHSPTNLFGTGEKNKKPVVIKVKVCSNPEKVLDTRIFDDYKELLDLYKEFFNELTKGTISDSIGKEKLQCMFFDWVHSNYEIEIFIAGFDKTKTNSRNSNSLKYNFKIPYIEYQMCVFDNRLILQKESVKDD